MDKRERAHDLAVACCNGYNACIDEGDFWEFAAEAAVRRAYEIDGVDDLLLTAEDSLIMYRDGDEYDAAVERLRAAIAKVREMRGE